MPFTPSHAVVALPFVRTPLLPAAIAIGAMTPDLPLFVRGTPLSYQSTHTNLALSTVLALALLVLWYVLLRPAVRELSPDALARRLPSEWDTPVLVARTWWCARRAAVSAVLLALSLLLGVVTHVVWDAFTHEGRWGQTLAPALGEDWGPLPGYKWLQHGSSVLGLAILAGYGLWWISRPSPVASVDRILPAGVRRLWWVSLPVILAGAWGIGFALYGPLTETWTAQHLAYRVLPPACAVWGASTVVLCLVIVVRRVRRVRAARTAA